MYFGFFIQIQSLFSRQNNDLIIEFDEKKVCFSKNVIHFLAFNLLFIYFFNLKTHPLRQFEFSEEGNLI